MNDIEILVTRLYKKDTYTLGKLFINGTYFCDTLEDKDRGLTCNMSEKQIAELKVKSETAIPIGTYIINMNTKTVKFKDKSWAKDYNGIVPRLENVKGYDGVLIHPGNYSTDTAGCLLVGENKIKGGLINSAATYRKLMDILMSTDKKIILTIR